MIVRYVVVFDGLHDHPPDDPVFESRCWTLGLSHLPHATDVAGMAKLFYLAWLVKELSAEILQDALPGLEVTEEFFDRHFSVRFIECYGDLRDQTASLRASTSVAKRVASSTDPRARTPLRRGHGVRRAGCEGGDLSRGSGTMTKMDNSLHVIGPCPVGCGLLGVLILFDRDDRPVFYSPCCGTAWRNDPGNAADEPARLADVVPSGVKLPSLDEVTAVGYEHVSTIRWSDWDDYLGDVRALLL